MWYRKHPDAAALAVGTGLSQCSSANVPKRKAFPNKSLKASRFSFVLGNLVLTCYGTDSTAFLVFERESSDFTRPLSSARNASGRFAKSLAAAGSVNEAAQGHRPVRMDSRRRYLYAARKQPAPWLSIGRSEVSVCPSLIPGGSCSNDSSPRNFAGDGTSCLRRT
jgi:hypothetical protein